jgi:hypothetical protein
LNEKVFLEKLASSGLISKDAKQLGIKYLASATAVLAHAENRPGLQLAYHDFEGRPTEFFRVRLLGPSRSFAAGTGKELRYLQPPGTGVQAYFPRNIDWVPIVADPSQPIYITEGELKAACACKHGYSMIGLGGVYSWRSAKRGIAFLPELEAIEWKERKTFIVFDSDAQINHQVMQALRHLCAELTARGARPYVVRLPDVPDLNKTGVDDLLVILGKEAMDRALVNAEPYGLAQELWDLNDKVCFVRDPGLIYELKTGARMSVMSFQREVYANLTHNEREETKNGFKLVKKQTAAEWIKWMHRLETRRVTYKPGDSRFTEGELNTWHPSGVKPAQGNVEPWRKLLAHLFTGDDTARVWFEQWCAYPLKFMGTKLLSAVVLWGVHQGTGKTLLGYSLARLYGDHNVSEINQEHLRSNFNDWLVDKQLIIGEEITGSDRRADADRLKALITQKVVRVSSKYVREYTVPAVANFFFTSNHPDAFFLEDTDRRFFVHEIQREPLPMSFYREYTDWLASPEGASALLSHLLHVDTQGFNPSGPAFETTSKRDMIEDNKSDLAAWVMRLRREPRIVLQEAGLPADVCVLTATQMLSAYDPQGVKRVTVNGLARELKRSLVKRLPTIGVAMNRGPTSLRFYVVQQERDFVNAAPKFIAGHWLKYFGGGPTRAQVLKSRPRNQAKLTENHAVKKPVKSRA